MPCYFISSDTAFLVRSCSPDVRKSPTINSGVSAVPSSSPQFYLERVSTCLMQTPPKETSDISNHPFFHIRSSLRWYPTYSGDISLPPLIRRFSCLLSPFYRRSVCHSVYTTMAPRGYFFYILAPQRYMKEKTRITEPSRPLSIVFSSLTTRASCSCVRQFDLKLHPLNSAMIIGDLS